MSTKTCILYFTLTPTQEAKTKQWSNSNRVNQHIAQHLYDYSKQQIKKANLPFIEINETQQTGNCFGEKIVHAIENVFQQGYEDVIVVGNDCINFNEQDLIRAKKIINTSANTIGLTKDGGVYLFSIKQSTFNAEQVTQLAALPWCTNKLGETLHDFLKSVGSVEQLSTKIDIDNEQALIQAFGHPIRSAFIRLLRNLLFSVFYKKNNTFHYPISSYILKGVFFRGPPLVN